MFGVQVQLSVLGNLMIAFHEAKSWWVNNNREMGETNLNFLIEKMARKHAAYSH